MLASISAITGMESASKILNFHVSLLPGSKWSRKVIGLIAKERFGCWRLISVRDVYNLPSFTKVNCATTPSP